MQLINAFIFFIIDSILLLIGILFFICFSAFASGNNEEMIKCMNEIATLRKSKYKTTDGNIMNLNEIKNAVNNGLTVHWSNDGYIVVKSNNDYLVKCIANNSCVGLTWLDGTFTYNENDFYIGSN